MKQKCTNNGSPFFLSSPVFLKVWLTDPGSLLHLLTIACHCFKQTQTPAPHGKQETYSTRREYKKKGTNLLFGKCIVTPQSPHLIRLPPPHAMHSHGYLYQLAFSRKENYSTQNIKTKGKPVSKYYNAFQSQVAVICGTASN